jgi:hypothetical protein
MRVLKLNKNASDKLIVHLRLLEIAAINFKYSIGLSDTILFDGLKINYPAGMIWGKHYANKKELTLTEEEEKIGQTCLQHCASYLCVLQIDRAFEGLKSRGLVSEDNFFEQACKITSVIRNTFAHNPYDPTWQIKPNDKDKYFKLENIIYLDTKGLEGERVLRDHYGGPLAILRLLEYAMKLLKQVQKNVD